MPLDPINTEKTFRDPSIHVKASDLEKILAGNRRIAEAFSNAGITFAEAVQNIQKAASALVPLARILVVAKNAAEKKKIATATKITDDLCDKFNGYVATIRMNDTGRSGSKIMRDSTAYSQLKSATTAAMDFCEEFGLSVNDGFVAFIKLGMSLMGRKYALNRFSSIKDKIITAYSYMQLVENDPKPDETAKFYKLWIKRSSQESGVAVRFHTDAVRYGEMITAREEADSFEADYANWIEAQFAGLSFVNAIPTLTQLHGFSAQDRYQKFMHTLSKDVNDKLAGMKFINDEEREYYIKYVFKK